MNIMEQIIFSKKYKVKPKVSLSTLLGCVPTMSCAIHQWPPQGEHCRVV